MHENATELIVISFPISWRLMDYSLCFQNFLFFFFFVPFLHWFCSFVSLSVPTNRFYIIESADLHNFTLNGFVSACAHIRYMQNYLETWGNITHAYAVLSSSSLESNYRYTAYSLSRQNNKIVHSIKMKLIRSPYRLAFDPIRSKPCKPIMIECIWAPVRTKIKYLKYFVRNHDSSRILSSWRWNFVRFHSKRETNIRPEFSVTCTTLWTSQWWI